MKKKQKKFLIPALAAALTISAGTAIALMGGANGENVGGAQSETQSGFIPVASLFSVESGVSVKSNQTTPSYVEEARNGVAVRSKNAKKVKYEKPINISDNTKDDLLFEMQITPEESGSVELKQFLIRFEDWNNPGCYFEISLVNYPWG